MFNLGEVHADFEQVDDMVGEVTVGVWCRGTGNGAVSFGVWGWRGG